MVEILANPKNPIIMQQQKTFRLKSGIPEIPVIKTVTRPPLTLILTTHRLILVVIKLIEIGTIRRRDKQ
jgi:hypothetical protein